ncbi:hypothetical protein SAMN05428950_101502 [Sphingomonas sp. OV641]|nr:hypothetical protein SAMN05428950_101502 [Sphingomonas sp. OV641]
MTETELAGGNALEGFQRPAALPRRCGPERGFSEKRDRP